MTEEEFEAILRKEGWKPTKLGDPSPSPLLVLSWMKWCYELGVKNSKKAIEVQYDKNLIPSSFGDDPSDNTF